MSRLPFVAVGAGKEVEWTLRPLSPAEGVTLNELDRAGTAYLAWRDEADELRTLALDSSRPSYGIGRHPGSDLCLLWDDEVSRAHAQLVRVAGQWAIEDDGLSTNGTCVNSSRVTRTRRLEHGDQILIGRTVIEFRDEHGKGTLQTRKRTSGVLEGTPFSDAHKKVLAEIARQLRDAPAGTPPPSNADLAQALHLSDETIKSHIRDIYARLDLAPGDKARRATLAQHAITLGFDLSH